MFYVRSENENLPTNGEVKKKKRKTKNKTKMNKKRTNVLSLLFQALQYPRWSLFSFVLCQRKDMKIIGLAWLDDKTIGIAVQCAWKQMMQTPEHIIENYSSWKQTGKTPTYAMLLIIFLPKKNLKTLKDPLYVNKNLRGIIWRKKKKRFS